jgi:hypothetical protein
MPKQRMATDVFKDGGLGPTGQAVYDHIKSKSGKDSNVILLQPGDDGYNAGGGYVRFDTPEDVYVDPGKGGAHVLAHELGHSQFKTDLSAKFVQNMLKYDKPYAPSDVQINELDPTKGSTIRYAYEKETVPTMLEEANAQGVAVGTTEALGLGNQEDKTMYATPTEYPESFGKRGIDRLDYQFSPEFEGRPLGIGISGSPEQREEYYRIQDNMPQRVERAYQRGKLLVQ